ncbi:MAG: peptidoglycan DD-metalloendopeptidase family protein [Pseudomonadota bacterium]|nr:peptidoglycan DD-metalloendopeptidase family protein [Pseudomonadota bacterium]
MMSSPQPQRAIKYLGALAAMGLGLCAGSIPADQTLDAAQAKAKLAAVRGQVTALANRLGAELKERDALSARLREADLGVTDLRRRLEALRGEQLAAERHSGELRAEHARIESSLDAERDALARQARAAYMIGRLGQIKLLSNQTDPASAGRMTVYYGYFARERFRRIADIRERMLRAQELIAQIDQAGDKLRALQVDTARQMAALEHAREERVLALAAITKRVSSGSQELAQLKREERAEESLVAELARVLQDLPVDDPQSFEALRGKLPWPVEGSLTAQYQDVRANLGQSGVRRNGVLIQTTRGAKVRAPHFGRVVYADWLQGLGLLLIIAHQGNYMTLYGHAEVLYKSVGDWVAPGDAIAGLSESGGAAPQLYFEIRDGRKPVDPKIWLKAKP